MKKFAFIIPPTVEILDLAGPVQVFTEAKFYGYDLTLEYYSYKSEIISTSGLLFNNIKDYRAADLREGDYVFMPGMDNKYVSSMDFKTEREFFNWLKKCSDKGILVCSICNGAFALGHAGPFERYRMYNALETDRRNAE